MTTRAAPHPLRKGVTSMREAVWEARENRDMYTGLKRSQMKKEDQNVDHVLEIQLIEYATLEIVSRNAELVRTFRDIISEPLNLNVTRRQVNQAKRGPFTAALNRLKKRDGALREISVAQLARAGKAKVLVDDGTWANVESEIALSYEAFQKRVGEARLTRAQDRITSEAMDSLHATLEKIQIF